jgi:hypothetical protein
MEDLRETLHQDEPPEALSDPLKALWWLGKGGLKMGPEWTRAHEICQDGEGQRAYDYVHALAHWIEGDTWNSDYWYGRVGTKRSSDSVEEEWARIVKELSKAD